MKADADKLGRFWLHRGTDGVAREEQLIVDFVINKSATGWCPRRAPDQLRVLGFQPAQPDEPVCRRDREATRPPLRPALRHSFVVPLTLRCPETG